MPLWLDRPDRPEAAAPLAGTVETELAIVGAGFTGLWTALLAKEAHPELDVVLVEAGRVGDGASGRNGGFVSTTLSHYEDHQQLGLPQGEPDIAELGRQNAQGFLDTLARHRLRVDFEPSGYLHVAVQPHQVDVLRAMHEADQQAGADSTWLDREGESKGLVTPPCLP